MSQPYPPHHQHTNHPGHPGHPGYAAAPQAYPPRGYGPPPMYPQPNVPPWPQPWPNAGAPEPIFRVRVIKHTGALVFLEPTQLHRYRHLRSMQPGATPSANT